MTKIIFKETISLATEIYKKSFKITFVLAFILSFMLEYFSVYMMKNGMFEYMQSNGEDIPANFPSGNILALIVLATIVATAFVYAMIILLQSIFIKQHMKSSDALKLALQIFSTRILSFTGAFILLMIVMSILYFFLLYLGMFIATIFFFIVFPIVLLEQKGIFEAFEENFDILKENFGAMMKLTLVVLGLMLIKLFLSLGLVYMFKNLGIEVNPVETSIQNIIITVVNSLVVPFIFSIVVATFLVTRENKVAKV